MDDIDNVDKEETLYSRLGCSCTATAEQITTEYHQKVRSCHPDKNPDNEEAAETFMSLQNAYMTLSDGAKRKEYDKWLFSGLAISFERWKEMVKQGHGAMHFGMKMNSKLPITEKANTDVEVAAPGTSNKTYSPTSYTDNAYSHRSGFSSGISKFRKYEI